MAAMVDLVFCSPAEAFMLGSAMTLEKFLRSENLLTAEGKAEATVLLKQIENSIDDKEGN